MRRALVEMAGCEGIRIAIVIEEPIYECHDVLVSTSRISLNGRSYPMADVTNVSIASPKAQWRLAAGCATISVVLAFSALLLINLGCAMAALAFAVAAALLRPAIARELRIEVGGKRLTMCNSNPKVIAEIADAISVAKRSVHTAKCGPVLQTNRAMARAARASGAA